MLEACYTADHAYHVLLLRIMFVESSPLLHNTIDAKAHSGSRVSCLQLGVCNVNHVEWYLLYGLLHTGGEPDKMTKKKKKRKKKKSSKEEPSAAQTDADLLTAQSSEAEPSDAAGMPSNSPEQVDDEPADHPQASQMVDLQTQLQQQQSNGYLPQTLLQSRRSKERSQTLQLQHLGPSSHLLALNHLPRQLCSQSLGGPAKQQQLIMLPPQTLQDSLCQVTKCTRQRHQIQLTSLQLLQGRLPLARGESQSASTPNSRRAKIAVPHLPSPSQTLVQML